MATGPKKSIIVVAGADKKLIVNSFLDALRFSPFSLEPMYYLAKYFRTLGEVKMAVQILRLACKITPFSKPVMESWIYEVGIKMEHLRCEYALGNWEQCLSISHELQAQKLTDLERQEMVDIANLATAKLESTIDQIFGRL